MHSAIGRWIDPSWWTDGQATRGQVSVNTNVIRCSFVARAFVHSAIGRWIDPSWWTDGQAARGQISVKHECYQM